MSGDPEQEFFSDGITEDITAFFDYLPCHRDYVDCLRQAGLPE